MRFINKVCICVVLAAMGHLPGALAAHHVL